MIKTTMILAFSVLTFISLNQSQSKPANPPVLGPKTLQTLKDLQAAHPKLSPLYSVVVISKESPAVGGCIIKGQGALKLNESVEDLSESTRRDLLLHEALYCANKAKENQS